MSIISREFYVLLSVCQFFIIRIKISRDLRNPISSKVSMVGRTGFEPVKAEPADLQSAAFDRFATYPQITEENIVLVKKMSIYD